MHSGFFFCKNKTLTHSSSSILHTLELVHIGARYIPIIRTLNNSINDIRPQDRITSEELGEAVYMYSSTPWDEIIFRRSISIFLLIFGFQLEFSHFFTISYYMMVSS